MQKQALEFLQILCVQVKELEQAQSLELVKQTATRFLRVFIASSKKTGLLNH